MSKIALTPNASGTGVVTIASPNTNTDRTITLPDDNGTFIYANASGNVGIGVTPSAWWSGRKVLQIGGSGGDAVLANSPGTANFLSLSSNFYLDASPTARYMNSGAATVYQQTSGAHQWYTAPSGTAGNAITFTQAMTLDASGNLLVGTTTLPSSSVSGTRIGTGFIYTAQTGTSASTHLAFINSNGQVGGVVVNGSSTAYQTSSDYRLKENIAPMQNALNTVARLNPVTYTWKADGSAGQGFIAHELQAVVPDCVSGEKDAVDAEGNPQYQGIDTSFLVATLVKAIQELTARVAALEAK